MPLGIVFSHYEERLSTKCVQPSAREEQGEGIFSPQVMALFWSSVCSKGSEFLSPIWEESEIISAALTRHCFSPTAASVNMLATMLEKRLQRTLAARNRPEPMVALGPLELWNNELISLRNVDGKANALKSTLLVPACIRAMRVLSRLAHVSIRKIEEWLAEGSFEANSLRIHSETPCAKLIIRAWAAVHPSDAPPPVEFDGPTLRYLQWQLARLARAMGPFVLATQRESLTLVRAFNAIDAVSSNVADGIWSSPLERAALARERPVVNQLWTKDHLRRPLSVSQCGAQATALALGLDEVRKTLRHRTDQPETWSLFAAAGNHPGKQDLEASRRILEIKSTARRPLDPLGKKYIQLQDSSIVWQAPRPLGIAMSIWDMPTHPDGRRKKCVPLSQQYIEKALISARARTMTNQDHAPDQELHTAHNRPEDDPQSWSSLIQGNEAGSSAPSSLTPEFLRQLSGREGKQWILHAIKNLPGGISSDFLADIQHRLNKTGADAWGTAVEKISIWARANDSELTNVAWRLFHIASPSYRGTFVSNLNFFAPAMRALYIADPPRDQRTLDVSRPLAKSWPYFNDSTKVWPMRSSFWVNLDSATHKEDTSIGISHRLPLGDGGSPGSQLGQGVSMYSAAPGAVLAPVLHKEDQATPLAVALLQLISLSELGLAAPDCAWTLFGSGLGYLNSFLLETTFDISGAILKQAWPLMAVRSQTVLDLPSHSMQLGLHSYVARILKPFGFSVHSFQVWFVDNQDLLADLRAFSWNRLAWSVLLDTSMSDALRASLFCLATRDTTRAMHVSSSKAKAEPPKDPSHPPPNLNSWGSTVPDSFVGTAMIGTVKLWGSVEPGEIDWRHQLLMCCLGSLIPGRPAPLGWADDSTHRVSRDFAGARSFKVSIHGSEVSSNDKTLKEDAQAELAKLRISDNELQGDPPIFYEGAPVMARFLGWEREGGRVCIGGIIPISHACLEGMRSALTNRTGLADSVLTVRRSRQDINMFQASHHGPPLRELTIVEPAPEPR